MIRTGDSIEECSDTERHEEGIRGREDAGGVRRLAGRSASVREGAVEVKSAVPYGRQTHPIAGESACP